MIKLTKPQTWERNLAFRLLCALYPRVFRPILFLLPGDQAHDLMVPLVIALDRVARLWDWLMLGPARRALYRAIHEAVRAK